MADELDDIGLDLRGNRPVNRRIMHNTLLVQAERGEITKEQVEEVAAAHGLDPFEQRPKLPRFDPKLQPRWSIVKAVAWIARRDFELVREQDREFCSEWVHWIVRKVEEHPEQDAEPVKRMGLFLESRSVPTVSRLALLDAVSSVGGNAPSTAVMTIRQAEAALWRALAEGHLIAEGLKADGSVVEIPSREWVHLRLCNDHGREILKYVQSEIEPYVAVTLRQSNLLRLWPANGKSSALQAGEIDRGGRPTEHDWPAIKDIAIEQVMKLGKPHRNNKRLPTKTQLIELIQAKCAERFDREPPISSLKPRLNQWLAEVRDEN
jgi:hypothetical protein